MAKLYKKDYHKVLACIPLVMAEALVSRLAVIDHVDTLEFSENHLFRDELLFLMDMPLQEVLNALTDHRYTKEKYGEMYVDMKDCDAEYHFQKLVKPILLLRLELGI